MYVNSIGLSVARLSIEVKKIVSDVFLYEPKINIKKESLVFLTPCLPGQECDSPFFFLTEFVMVKDIRQTALGDVTYSFNVDVDIC